MAFGVRNNPDPGGTNFYACPACAAVFPDTPQGRRDYKAHLRTHDLPPDA